MTNEAIPDPHTTTRTVATADVGPAKLLIPIAAATTILAIAGFVWSLQRHLPPVAIAGLGFCALVGFACMSVLDGQLTDCAPNRRTVLVWLVGILVVAAAAVFMSWNDLLVPDSFGFAALCAAIYAWVRIIELWRQHVAFRRPGQRVIAAVVAGVAFGLAGIAAVVAMIANGEDWPEGVWRVVFGLSCLAAFAGGLAVEFCSAKFPDRLTGGWIRLVCGAVGVAAVAVAVALILLRGKADESTTVWLIVALALVTVLLITSNDTIILLGVLLLVSFWATVPRSVSFPPGQAAVHASNDDDLVSEDSAAGDEDTDVTANGTTAPPDPNRWFAVLGDSYISGEGADVYYDGQNISTQSFDGYAGQCRKSPTAWPMLLNPVGSYDAGDIENVPRRVLFAACSGAVTSDVRVNECGTGDDIEPKCKRDDNDDQVADLATEINLIGTSPEFVFISVGGNDVQFSDVGTVCIAPYDCTDYVEKVKDTQLDDIGPDLQRTYAEIRQVVGADVPIIAVPYPIPVSDNPDCRGVILTDRDRDAINGFAAELDDKIREAALVSGVWYLDAMEDALADVDAQLCAPNGQSGLNFLDINPKAGSLWAAIDPRNWTHNFIHPNERGHQAMAAAVMRWLTTDNDDPQWNPVCILAETCGAAREAANQLAGKPSTLNDDESRSPALWYSLGRTAVSAVLVGGLAVFGWWLIFTAIFPRGPATGTRKLSWLERALTSWALTHDQRIAAAATVGVPTAAVIDMTQKETTTPHPRP